MSHHDNINILAAPLSTAQKNALPDSAFAFIDSSGGRHLPYKGSNGKVDLPHVRNALARLNQVQGMPDDEKAKVKTKLQSALKNAKASDDTIMRAWQAIQASDTDVLPERVMLLRSGDFNTEKYGSIPLEASDLTEMKENFDNGVGMAGDGKTGIPVDFAHQSHLNAAAWIKGLEVQADDGGGAELWGTDIEYSGTGRTALLNKEYKCLSSDFYPKAFGEWVDPESGVTAQNVIVGAALTNRPMFTGNQTVLASSESEDDGGVHTIININASENKEQEMNIDQLRVKGADEVTGPEQRYLQAHAAELTADEQKKFELVTASDKKETPKVIKASEVTGSEGTVTVQAADLKAQNDKLSGLETTVGSLKATVEASTKEKTEGFVDEQISKGKIVAGEKPKWVKAILADDGARELLENLPENKLLGGKQGSSTQDSVKSAKEDLTDKAKELMATDTTGKMGIQAAMTKVSQDPKNKELVGRVAEENRALAGITGATV